MVSRQVYRNFGTGKSRHEIGLPFSNLLNVKGRLSRMLRNSMVNLIRLGSESNGPDHTIGRWRKTGELL
jgi:hypothetical protein